MNTHCNFVVPAVDHSILAASAACVFSLPDGVTVDSRRAAIGELVAAKACPDSEVCLAITMAIDARLEAFCCTIRTPLVRAWMATETSIVKEAFNIAAFAPVEQVEDGYEFNYRIFFTLLLSRVPVAGTA